MRYDISISILAPLLYLWIGTRTSPGPSYTSDEFAYLAKAASIAGNAVDYPSSWHSGYPILISPLFRFGLNPQNIWILVLIVNCIFWMGSFLVLSRLIRLWFPDLNDNARSFVIFITVLYPGWGSISSYAFPNSVFVLVYLLVFLVQSHSKIPNHARLFITFTLLGFLYWIHPIGLVVFAAFVISQVLTIRNTKIAIIRFFYSLISILLILTYSKLIHPVINQGMSLTSFPTADDYRSHFEGQLQFIKTMVFWKALIFEIFGIWSAALVATLGLILLPVIKICGLFRQKSATSKISDPKFTLLIFGLLSLLLVSLLTAFSLVSPVRSTMQLDRWIFLRYVECVLLPLLPVGLAMLYFDRIVQIKKTFLVLPIALYVIGWILDSDLKDRGPTSQVDNHFIMTVGFWPISMFNNFHIDTWASFAPFTSVPYSIYSFRIWMIVGVIGIAICFLRLRILLSIFCLLQFFSVSQLQSNWHEYLFRQYANPPKAVEQIRSKIDPDSCVGYMQDLDSGTYRSEEYNLFTYYLYDYKFKMISKEDWVEFCDGPLIVTQSDYVIISNYFESFNKYKLDAYYVIMKN